MQFPVIEHIDQVREAIKDRPEFIEAPREFRDGHGVLHEYTVFNYMVAHTDSFDCPIRRECRGLIFDYKGEVLSRRFHKFFNLGEKEETFPENIDWNSSHVLMEKRDGSMITPLVFDSSIVRYATKMGITDIGMAVFNKFNQRNYVDFAVTCHNAGWTPIFEYTSPHNRIVLQYDNDELVLLAMRHNINGTYKTYNELQTISMAANVPLVKAINLSTLLQKGIS